MRHLWVDMVGLLLSVAVTPASRPVREGRKVVLQRIAGWLSHLRKVWGDGGYPGDAFDQWVREFHPKAHVRLAHASPPTGP